MRGVQVSVRRDAEAGTFAYEPAGAWPTIRIGFAGMAGVECGVLLEVSINPTFHRRCVTTLARQPERANGRYAEQYSRQGYRIEHRTRCTIGASFRPPCAWSTAWSFKNSCTCDTGVTTALGDRLGRDRRAAGRCR